MKKIGIFVSVAFVLLAALLIVLSLSLNKAVKAGMETIGPRIAGVPVTVERVHISLLSGSGKIESLFIGNPKGFHTESAVKMGSIKIAVETGSLLSDRVIVNEIILDAPEITYETLSGDNNISRIIKNIKSSAPETPKNDKDREKKFQINDLIIRNGKIKLSATFLKGEALAISLPDIHLKDIGKRSNGASGREIAMQVFDALNKGVLQAVAGSVQPISKGAGILRDTGNKAGEAVTKGISGIFKGLK